MINKDNFTHRRKALAKIAQQPLIVISGGDLVQKSSDEAYPFQQDGYFYYLTGVKEPGWLLVMDVQRGKEFLVSTNESDYRSDVWDDLTPQSEISRISGINEIQNRRDGWTYIRTKCSGYQSIGSIVPGMRYTKFYGMYINPAKTMLIERLKKAHSDANIVDISHHVRELRTVKDADEIEAIKKAIALTKEGFELVGQNLQNYHNEADIELEFLTHFKKNRAEYGYEPIVASGRSASIIHARKNSNEIDNGSLILMDVGAKIDEYTADITRTYVKGEMSQRQREVWEEVKAVHAASLEYLKPGVLMRDHEAYIEQLMGHSLNKLGIIDNMLRKSIRRYYPHAISHHLGLDVHDGCSYDMPLKPGAVITVEPGIYILDESIGVRIEDNILITKNGVEVLSSTIPYHA